MASREDQGDGQPQGTRPAVALGKAAGILFSFLTISVLVKKLFSRLNYGYVKATEK